VALEIGTENADSGMAKAIYDQLDALLSPPLKAAAEAPDARPQARAALDAARDGWKKIAFAVATGVITHVTANMEIAGVQTTGDVAASGSGLTGTVPGPGPHAHPMTLTATQAQVTFRQSNDGTGRVR
jgi:hypothetical protein